MILTWNGIRGNRLFGLFVFVILGLDFKCVHYIGATEGFYGDTRSEISLY
jgi:hypothetical protein